MLDEESPLSTEIMGTVIPRDFRFPDLKYSGRSDPLVHIEHFNDMTGVQGLTPAQRYRVFPLTLEGRAREWYRKLLRGSIRGYEQMCQKLAEQFRGAVAPEDDMMELMGMKQEEQEPLRDFVKRYHRVVLDLGAFNHPQALRGLKEGVRISRLWYNLRSPLVQNYSAGAPRALHTANSRTGQSGQLPSISARDDIHDSRTVQLIDQNPAYRQYTLLKVLLEELYERIEGRGLLYPPAPITKPAHRRDKSRFCKFHDTHGHTISQCRDLKIQVEDLVRNRYLDEYVDGMSPVIESQYTRDEGGERGLEREQPTIRVIAGGPILAGDSNRARKNCGKYALTSKEVLFNLPATKKAKVQQIPIMWTDDDEEGILYTPPGCIGD
ncbi:uncharacterized protein LOC112095705 [Citrus clementina]|uniref:uncharacterized protein LOC112095705 n=1 Tax=Citrus clementina TaxID=85681 RepID=UPI000CED19D8|nr:uncharacterized protein LOC112095705 [Citrus x clementina]